MTSLSLAEVRRLLIDRQFPRVGTGPDGLREAFDRLGYIQLDTIQVVERAHHHTLWNRVEYYSPDHLHLLQAQTRDIFEYWGHAASFLPMSDYRFYRPKMEALARNYGWEHKWWNTYRELGEAVLERIRAEGPLSTADFESPKQPKQKGMWPDWKPAKAALEILFWRGELMVTERRNFQRVYDLTERVLPPDIDTTPPDPLELGAFQVRRALGAGGIVSENDIINNLFLKNRPGVKQALQTLTEAGEIVPVQLPELGKARCYAFPADLETIPTSLPDQVRILSPFDNLVVNRERILERFGFDYSLECFLPEAKRVYGYFSLPVLRGDRFIARIDAKAERREGVLALRSVWFERNSDKTDFAPLTGALANFATFNRCRGVRVDRVEPAARGKDLARALKKAGL
jgi:uncharacterized protein